jgi:hypothetical protein
VHAREVTEGFIDRVDFHAGLQAGGQAHRSPVAARGKLADSADSLLTSARCAISNQSAPHVERAASLT